MKIEIGSKYLNQVFFNGIGDTGKVLGNEDITFLNFKKWKVFYEADRENWKFYHDTYLYGSDSFIYFPYYIKDERQNKYTVIKFPTTREYKKFYKFYKNNISSILDGVENQKEILELAHIITERNKEKINKLIDETQEEYKKYLKLHSTYVNEEEDDIQKFFKNRQKQKLVDF